MAFFIRCVLLVRHGTHEENGMKSRYDWKLTKLLFILFVLASSMSGCATQYAQVGETLKEAFVGQEDVQLTQEQAQALPYASSYVRIDQGQQVMMVLALVEPNTLTGQPQLKWVSADGAMLVTENGRIVKTINLPTGNLLRRAPVITTANTEALSLWQAGQQTVYFDWQAYYGIQAEALLISQKSQLLSSVLWQRPTTRWQEQITLNERGLRWTNEYWVDDKGIVLKTIQYLGPDMSRIEMNIIKPFVN